MSVDRDLSSMRHCPLCGGAHTRLIRPLRYALFDDLGVSGESPLVSCQDCGMVFNDVCGGAPALARYYAGNAHYLASATAGTGGSSPAELSRYQRLLAHVEAHLDQDAAIVDVGCGKGGFLSFLQERGYRNLWGVEPSQTSRDAATGKHAAKFVADVRALPEGLRPRLIVLSHVLEHLHDPLAELRALAAGAADDTLFYLECPNTRALPDSAWTTLYFEHINHFDLELMVALVQAGGLTVEARGLQSFLPGAGAPAECLYLLARKDGDRIGAAPAQFSDLATELDARLPVAPLDGAEVAELSDANKRLAIWGISQYAMLVLGAHPEVAARLVALYDASPAKQGRTLSSVSIQAPSRIAQLDGDELLLLPRSGYTDAMLAQLPSLGFHGACRII